MVNWRARQDSNLQLQA